MKHLLDEEERNRLDGRIADAEKRTGAQIVLAVVERCDSYPELPWKAFALGASVAGLAFLAANAARPAGGPGSAALLAASSMLATGAAGALLCVFAPGFARLFLDAHRAEGEARQYASTLFLSRELFATRRRSGVLLLVSLFERQVVVLPDAGLADRLGTEALQSIIAAMATHLKAGRVARAQEEGLTRLEGLLAGAPTGTSGDNELPDAIIEEKGP